MIEANFIENYREVSSFGNYRSVLRNWTLNCLSGWYDLKDTASIMMKPRVQFLLFHHVFKDEEASFRKLLTLLQKHFQFISYSDAIQKILNSEIDKPYLVLSSDDGFKSNLAAATILQEFGVSACFFVNPSIIGETDKKKISEYCDKILHFSPVEFLTWNDVDTMLKMGHEIGSHSMDHLRIAKSTVEHVKGDLGKSFSILKHRCGDVKHFAFPYGTFADFNELGRSVCFEAGFYSCASAERGSHVNNSTKITNTELCIRRDHIVFDWKLEHIMYFLKRSSINAKSPNNLFNLNA